MESTSENGKKTKLKKGAIYSLIADIIQKTPISLNYPEFTKTFHALEPEPGKKIFLEELANQVVRIIDPSAITNAILNYCRDSLCLKSDCFNLTFSEAEAAMKYYCSTLMPLAEKPAIILQKSVAGLTYHRLPFDLEHTENLDECPTFAEIGSRMTNFEPFCMRIASVFDPRADRKQTVYIWGPKDSGKSQIALALARICGATVSAMGEEDAYSGAYVTLGTENLKSQYYKAVLVGKRVLVVNEATAKFLNSEDFKALTGDSLHSINDKYKPIYHAVLYVIIFFVSNEPPKISNDSALIERIIECQIASISGDGKNLVSETVYQEKLLNELPKFLGYCEHLYKPFSGGKRIPCTQDSLLELVDEVESEAVDFFESNLVADKDARVSRAELYRFVRRGSGGISSLVYGHWLEVWRKRYDILLKRIEVTDQENPSLTKRPWFVCGVAITTPEPLKRFSPVISFDKKLLL